MMMGRLRILEHYRTHSKILGTDYGKIIALHQAGWKNKDIAGDMGIEEKEVAETIRKYASGEITLHYDEEKGETKDARNIV